MVVRYLLLFAGIYTLIFGSVSALVYWHASNDGRQRPLKWATFVFFTGGLGFMAYVIDSDQAVAAADDPDPFSLPGTPPDENTTGDRTPEERE